MKQNFFILLLFIFKLLDTSQLIAQCENLFGSNKFFVGEKFTLRGLQNFRNLPRVRRDLQWYLIDINDAHYENDILGVYQLIPVRSAKPYVNTDQKKYSAEEKIMVVSVVDLPYLDDGLIWNYRGYSEENSKEIFQVQLAESNTLQNAIKAKENFLDSSYARMYHFTQVKLVQNNRSEYVIRVVMPGLDENFPENWGKFKIEYESRSST